MSLYWTTEKKNEEIDTVFNYCQGKVPCGQFEKKHDDGNASVAAVSWKPTFIKESYDYLSIINSPSPYFEGYEIALVKKVRPEGEFMRIVKVETLNQLVEEVRKLALFE